MTQHNHITSATLSRVLESTPDCVFLLDPMAKILWINSVGVKLFDAASQEVRIGKSHEVLW